MANNIYGSKTPAWQRIVIWVIAIALAGGTLLGFFFMVFAAKNPELDSTGITSQRQQEAQADMEKLLAQHQEKVDAQNAELSREFFPILNSFKSRVAAFEPSGIGDVKTENLKVGDGEEITSENTNYSMYYIGWKPTGEIFDSSFNDDSEVLKSPLAGGGSYIAGWKEGVIGMKIGGVREITIPADKAYGSDGRNNSGGGCADDLSTCSIAPDTPLKFIVMAVPTPDSIPFPKGTLAACEKAFTSYAQQYGVTATELCKTYGYDNEEK